MISAQPYPTLNLPEPLLPYQRGSHLKRDLNKGQESITTIESSMPIDGASAGMKHAHPRTSIKPFGAKCVKR